MAWSMPNSGQWNPGIGMTADMMGSYTQEQWALMQQQNWQQWSQWQHQYAQWQNQIGGEYAKHLQGLQALAGFQPVAAVAVPPPVPPPDKPPPPPPHENDQPLYGSAVVKAVSSASTVKPLKSTQPDCNNGNTTTGNNQNRSYIADPHSEKQSTQGVNSEALRMLAEEEKSFDIQFQKWEEEIEKWKKENVNHPDKQAYREYEQKFEACRAQLLERRQLMKIKRDNLMGNVQPASTTTKTARDFIEPVQMFDYDHKSKDGDNDIKKDFEKEVDELFSRKPRTTDRDVWSSERLFSRDYDRGSARDDFKDRSNVPNRFSEFYDRRVDDRRYDDRDRLRRQDFERRDRTGDNERLRDIGYGRDRFTERDLGIERDLERDKDFGRERDFRRDRDPGRDRDMDREMDVSRGRDFGRDRDLLRERDNGRDKNFGRDPVRDRFDRRDMSWNRSRSRDKDIRKRGHSRENDSNDSFGSKKTKDSKEDPAQSQGLRHVVMIDDLLEPPGRDIRPAKIIIILRGVPGSGKSYLAKLIRDKEAEQGVTVRIMSIDDYFMHESEKEEKDPITGKITKKPSLKYEYDETQVENYMNSLRRAFKRSLNDGFFTFLIFDAINDQLKSYAEIWSFGKQKGFQVYVCTMEADTQTCYKRNIHNRSLKDIEDIKSRFYRTPAHHIQLDATTLLQNASIREVQMEDAEDVTMEDADVVEVDSSFTSKWEKMDDAAQLARLDGTSKPLRPSQLSMEDYLQLDEWKPNVSKPGKKTVRWADLEERREQEKMRAIGFVVGQTDWQRMTDPTMGSSALTQTKYIERVRRS
ncbi:YLP motif-containing protein 1-like isoform X3 [Pararge aegeria]|uniref:YLP motif-containing protein 1-like isoform X3 n=1 Tax=Pararge aegeria TaxID=116150 RepID=UPI0019D152DD|nr:YLP motif-containing protein 1-like isoform X3 [Pararge aegeria]